MQLAILLIVICAVSGLAGDPPFRDAFPWPLAAAFLLLTAAPWAAARSRRSLAKKLASGQFDGRQAAATWESWQEITTWIWAGSALALFYLGGWAQVARSFAFTLDWPLADELLILTPPMASLLMLWVAGHRVDQLLRLAAGEEPVSLASYVMLRVRHHLGLTLLPALAIVGIQETAVRLHWTSGVEDQRAWWLWGLLLAGIVFGMPWLLRCLWQTQRAADSPLKRRLLESCRRLGCGVRDIVVWRTGQTLANAAVAGLLPGMRMIFLSDGLIARLNDDELDVVVRHEAAHLVRRHLWQRLMILALPMLTCLAIQSRWPHAIEAVSDGLVAAGIAPVWQMSLVMPLAVLTYALLTMGWLARQHEYDADLAACTICGQKEVDAGAAADLHAALLKLVGDSDEYRRGRWLHPSVIERVAFLGSAINDPLLATRFRRRQAWVSWLFVAMCAVAVGIGLWPHP